MLTIWVVAPPCTFCRCASFWTLRPPSAWKPRRRWRRHRVHSQRPRQKQRSSWPNCAEIWTTGGSAGLCMVMNGAPSCHCAGKHMSLLRHHAANQPHGTFSMSVQGKAGSNKVVDVLLYFAGRRRSGSWSSSCALRTVAWAAQHCGPVGRPQTGLLAACASVALAWQQRKHLWHRAWTKPSRWDYRQVALQPPSALLMHSCSVPPQSCPV
mgnify:CR=1 FL=1